MKKQNKLKTICRVPECFNTVNNFYEKWQLNLCIFHLIDFIRWFKKDEQISAIYNRFCEKWEEIKDSNKQKAKKKIKQKIQELEIYFENQRKAAIEFETKSSTKNFMI